MHAALVSICTCQQLGGLFALRNHLPVSLLFFLHLVTDMTRRTLFQEQSEPFEVKELCLDSGWTALPEQAGQKI